MSRCPGHLLCHCVKQCAQLFVLAFFSSCCSFVLLRASERKCRVGDGRSSLQEMGEELGLHTLSSASVSILVVSLASACCWCLPRLCGRRSDEETSDAVAQKDKARVVMIEEQTCEQEQTCELRSVAHSECKNGAKPAMQKLFAQPSEPWVEMLGDVVRCEPALLKAKAGALVTNLDAMCSAATLVGRWTYDDGNGCFSVEQQGPGVLLFEEDVPTGHISCGLTWQDGYFSGNLCMNDPIPENLKLVSSSLARAMPMRKLGLMRLAHDPDRDAIVYSLRLLGEDTWRPDQVGFRCSLSKVVMHYTALFRDTEVHSNGCLASETETEGSRLHSEDGSAVVTL